MSAGWVAAGVRGRGLLRRRLGGDGASRLAALPSLAAALAELGATPYGREIHPGMDLAAAQHGVSATMVWHLRILAGWGPPLGAGPLRVFAGGFEIANITGYLAALSGGQVPDVYELGSLAAAWPAVLRSRTAAEVRAALTSSPWGDPGSEELAIMRLALQLAWARRVFDGSPGAADCAVAYGALVVARVIATGSRASLGPGAVRDATHLLGPGWAEATSLEDLTGRLPRVAARGLDGVRALEDLWRAEARWWSTLDTAGAELVARPRADASVGVGVAARLAADAWRVRAALAVAAGGGGGLAEVLDGVA